MKRVLFLLGAYYPAPKANGICCERVIEEMQARGYTVDVVAFAPEWPGQASTVWNGTHIEYIRGSMYYRTMRDAETGVLRGPALAIKKKLSRLKDIAFTPSWPDNSKLCTQEFLHKAEMLHKKNSYDAIIGVVSPISALCAAAVFKKRHPEVKMIAYFLDAVSGGMTPSVLSKELGIRMALRWEKKCCQRADSIVVMQSHEEHHKKYSSQMPYYDRIRVLDIPLLCPSAANAEREADGKTHIVYVGAINMAVKDPSYVLRLAKELPESIVVDFYGPIDKMEIFEPFADCKQIRIHGEVPHDRALEVQRKADFLLNIGSTNTCMIPCKIFEYMSSCKPIITTYQIKDEPSLPYLKRYDACLAIEESEEALHDNLQSLLSFIEAYQGRRADMETVLREFKGNTPDSFVDEIDRLFAAKGREDR